MKGREHVWSNTPETGMGKDAHPNFMLCGTCHGLHEDKPQPGFATPHRCACSRTDEPTWPRYDFNEHLHLCECCKLVPLRSGSRWSVWFCEECKARVRNLNSITGWYVIPIGRHSLMGGIGIEGSELVDADDRRFDELVDGFADQMRGWSDSIDHLHAFAVRRTVFLTDAVGLDATRDLQLDTWLQRVRPHAAASPLEFGKEGSFDSLVRWFASD